MLPRYGFEGSPKAVAAIAPWQSHFCSLQGVFDMLQQFDRPEISSNPELLQQEGFRTPTASIRSIPFVLLTILQMITACSGGSAERPPVW